MEQTEYGGHPGQTIRTWSAIAQPAERGCMRVVCTVSAAQEMTRLGVSCIRIRNRYGADVETIWNTDACRGGMTGHNCARHTVSELIRLPAGEYAAVVTFYAKSGQGSDSVTCRTEPVKIE